MLASFIITLFFALTGCQLIADFPAPMTDGGVGDSCLDDRNCRDGLTCVDGVCGGGTDGDADGDADADEDIEADGDADSDVDIEADGDADSDVDGADGAVDGDSDEEGPPACDPETCDDGVDCTIDECSDDDRCIHRTDETLCVTEDSEVCDPDEGCAQVIWVDGDCVSCGAGTADSPFESIGEAFPAIDSGARLSVIRIRTGSYRESVVTFSQAAPPLIIEGTSNVTWSTTGEVTFEVGGAASVTLRGITMTGGQTGLACLEGATCHVAECELVDSSSFGVIAAGTALIDIRRSLISGNQRAGARIDADARASATNCFVVGNGSDTGEAGGFWIRSAEATLDVVNCTIADNWSWSVPGAVRDEWSATFSLFNSIVWNNSENFTTQCQHCALGSESLAGDEDPQFVVDDDLRSNASDYRLTETSPARDRGELGADVPSHDYWGSPRGEGTIDSGAHEY